MEAKLFEKKRSRQIGKDSRLNPWIVRKRLGRKVVAEKTPTELIQRVILAESRAGRPISFAS